jgi:hypothetical protein
MHLQELLEKDHVRQLTVGGLRYVFALGGTKALHNHLVQCHVEYWPAHLLPSRDGARRQHRLSECIPHLFGYGRGMATAAAEIGWFLVENLFIDFFGQCVESACESCYSELTVSDWNILVLTVENNVDGLFLIAPSEFERAGDKFRIKPKGVDSRSGYRRLWN